MLQTLFQNNSLLLFTIAVPLSIIAIVFLIGVLAKRYWDQYSTRIALDKQLKLQFTSDFTVEESTKVTIAQRWNEFWGKRLVDSGVNILAVRRDNAGKVALISTAVVFVLFSFIFKFQIIGAAIVSIGLLALLALVLDFKANKRTEKLSDEIPAFLSSMLASLQTSANYRTILLEAISTTPPELHNEFIDIENQLNAGGSTKQVLLSNYNSFSAEELRFLMICVIIAVDTGSSKLSDQIKIIQEIVANRQRVRRKRDQAVASLMPTIWVATIFLPLLFLYTYFSQPIARQFWFHSFLSWVVFIIVILLYGSALFISKKLVDKINKL
jgi:Flp pilus assembly protein TadB